MSTRIHFCLNATISLYDHPLGMVVMIALFSRSECHLAASNTETVGGIAKRSESTVPIAFGSGAHVANHSTGDDVLTSGNENHLLLLLQLLGQDMPTNHRIHLTLPRLVKTGIRDQQGQVVAILGDVTRRIYIM